MEKNCKICGSKNIETIYHGQIRGSQSPGTVDECTNCHTQFLEKPDKTDYEGFEYRHDYGDDELVRHLPHITQLCTPKNNLLGKKVCDIGASNGGYMTAIDSFCKEIVGVEVNQEQRTALSSRYTMYDSIEDCVDKHAGTFDTVTCWHVIEHVEDPVQFLSHIKTLLKKDGKAFISTPNRREILMQLLDSDFAKFFYRTAHNYYFDEHSLDYACSQAGLASLTCYYGHSFGIGNTFGWLKEKKPAGDGIELCPNQSETMDFVWTAWLETLGLSDTLYMVLNQKEVH